MMSGSLFVFASVLGHVSGSCLLPSLSAAGAMDVDCEDIVYTFSVPAGCSAASRCGLILDVHGAAMTAALSDANTGLRASGGAAGYIVVQPTAPIREVPNIMGVLENMTVWGPSLDHPKLEAMLRQIVAAAEVDANRVHVTGVSQGAFAAWNLLCMAPDVICSVAPLVASGLDDWSAELGYGATCFGNASLGLPGPATKRAILNVMGTMDWVAQIALARTQKEYVVAAYEMTEADMTTLHQDAEYEWLRWTKEGVTFEYLEHSYVGNTYPGMGGHCFPKEGDGCDFESLPMIGGEVNSGCCANFTWSEIMLDFLVRHPCSGPTSIGQTNSALTTSAPGPTPTPADTASVDGGSIKTSFAMSSLVSAAVMMRFF